MSEKRIPGIGVKDANGIYQKASPIARDAEGKPLEAPPLPPGTRFVLEPSPSPEVDISHELGRALEVLRREVVHLMSESSSGKLAPNSSRDLVNYIKLLNELDRKEKDAAEAMADDLLKNNLNESQ